jgi:hypothetical protein
MRIGAALIDSGDHHTERVYEFTRKHKLRSWHAIVGRAGIGRPLLTAKEDVYTSLRITKPGAGTRVLPSQCAVPTSATYSEASSAWRKSSAKNLRPPAGPCPRWKMKSLAPNRSQRRRRPLCPRRSRPLSAAAPLPQIVFAALRADDEC